MDQNINANLAACIQSSNSIGGTSYYNICNHTTQWIPWGSADWLGAFALCGVGLLMTLVLIGIIFIMLDS